MLSIKTIAIFYHSLSLVSALNFFGLPGQDGSATIYRAGEVAIPVICEKGLSKLENIRDFRLFLVTSDDNYEPVYSPYVSDLYDLVLGGKVQFTDGSQWVGEPQVGVTYIKSRKSIGRKRFGLFTRYRWQNMRSIVTVTDCQGISVK
jgi:hypothetical protein